MILAILLLASLLATMALTAWAWLRFIWRLASKPQPRGRAAIRQRLVRDKLTTARGGGWWIIDEQTGSWPRQWPIAGTRRFLPGNGWSSAYDLDGRRGLAEIKRVMAAEGEGIVP